ncbi:MAG: PilZ domain-containing protein [Candidatus Omnitrophica bacterium]|nr:PilZ domain-containing protein [Candidatus Omnitrophota bacterium]
MQERRRFVRIPDQAEISYKILPNPKSAMFFIKDIGQGGIRFFVEECVPQNSLLEIRLTIKEIPFSFKAVVKARWVKKEDYGDRYEIGVEFINIPKEATEHLIRYIESVIKKAGS